MDSIVRNVALLLIRFGEQGIFIAVNISRLAGFPSQGVSNAEEMPYGCIKN
jgi:hypothetical protein